MLIYPVGAELIPELIESRLEFWDDLAFKFIGKIFGQLVRSENHGDVILAFITLSTFHLAFSKRY